MSSEESKSPVSRETRVTQPTETKALEFIPGLFAMKIPVVTPPVVEQAAPVTPPVETTDSK